MTCPSTADSNPEINLTRKIILFLTAALVCIVILELGSVVIFKLLVSSTAKETVKGLTGIGSFPVTKIPNTFWHHGFNPEHLTYKGQLNSYGTKGSEFTLPKPKGELRVVCVGDSTVEGTGVSPDETLPYYLEEILIKRIHILPRYDTVKVINGGIGSHNSAFNLAYLEFRLLHFDPDVVVIKSSYNDYLPYCVPGMTYDYTHVFPNPFHRIRPSHYWSLARYSYFLRIVGLVLFREEVENPFPDFSGHMTSEQFQKMDFESNADKFFVYAENIRSMILLCKGRGIDVLILDLPVSPDPDHFGKHQTFGARFKELIKRLEMELERITEEEQTTFVRTGPFDRTDFWDHCHNTASGNRKIAENLATALLNSAARKNTHSSRAAE